MCFSGTEEYLKAKYKSLLSRLEPIPGEEFGVSLDDSKLMMKPKFEFWEVDLESRENKDKKRYNQKLNTDKAKYKCLNISELSDVFASVGEIAMNVRNLQSKLITLIGDPGVGKTTAAQRLAWDWASGKSDISQRFKLTFFVPVRQVRHKSLMDVLSNLKLLPESDGIQHLEEISKDCLFILDGADENEITGDLHHLITGKLYPDSTILLTARPEANYMKSLQVFQRFRVMLLGTDDETVHRYMREAVSPSSDKEWESFQHNYKEKMPDNSLMNIPLYLSILCAMFKDHIARGLKCTNLKIPESSTELFSAFLHVIITRWLTRMNRIQSFSFEKNPLDTISTIPGDIKIILYFMGKLCYKDLTKHTSNYQFTDAEARECLLDMQVIKDCGLFNVGKSDKHEIFYLIHKQLQEYLAALYLSYEGTKEHIFHNLLYSKKNKGKPLFHVMRSFNAVRLVQFACGLSGEFFKSLLNIATLRFSLSVRRVRDMTLSQNTADIYYESVLFTEHHPGDLSDVRPDNLHGFTELKKYLVDTKIRQIRKLSHEHIPVFDVKCLRKLCGLFDKTLSLQLLSRFYDINVKPVGGEQSKVKIQSGLEIKLSLDQLQTELLNVVRIHSVDSVHSAGESAFVDIPGLLQTFPNLRELLVNGYQYIPYCNELRSDRLTRSDKGDSLTHVTLDGGMRYATLPKSHVQKLSQLRNLSYLKLIKINIPLVVTPTTEQIWSHLQYFKLSCKPDDEGSGVYHLLKSSGRSLTECELYIHCVVNTLSLTGEGLKNLTCVEDLTFLSYDHGKPNNLCETLQRVLPHLTKLHKLGVHYSSVHDTLDRFVDTVCERTNIRHLWLQGMKNRKLPRHCEDKLTQKGVKVTK